MSQYASKTTVSVGKSIAEIKGTLKRYGADQFGYVEDSAKGLVSIEFKAMDRRVRFLLDMPKLGAYSKHSRGERSPETASKLWEQACRQRWRALAICVKAKLEAVESGISTFGDEFMANIVLPSNETVGDLMNEQIELAYMTQEMPAGIAGFLSGPKG